MPRPPCFVVILSDDQAACDLGCLGATDLLTPNLDRLAASGAILRSWYSNSPVCSPSRASLLTGRYPGNAGVRSILRGHRTAIGLPADVPTLAGVLRPLGYRTALYGKWHLGVREGSRPHDRGFDEWFGFLAGCVDYYSHIFYFDMDSGHDPTHDLWEDGREVWRNGEYFTNLVTERAVSFIRRTGRTRRPFFLYVPYSAPHWPMHAPREYVDRFPALVSWPRSVPAGSDVRELGLAIDIFPTFLTAAGGDPRGYELDGLDVLPMLAEGAPSPHRDVFWEMGRQTAVRRGKWKLVLNGQLVESDRTERPIGPPQDDVFLADLEADPGETRNQRDEKPELVSELRSAAERWRAGIEARWDRQWLPQLDAVGVTAHE